MILTCDVQELIDIRRRHQTRQAETGVRVNPGTPMASNLSEKQQFLKRINEVIKSQEDRGVGTGLERDHRWRKAAPGAREGVIDGKLAPAPTAGSSANASKVATGNANQQLKRRQNTFRANGVPSEIESARVTALTPLSAATYTASPGTGYNFGQFVIT
ncbi:hypothetical protein R3P38DRAFT_2584549 [Favolaschia claudopus]|uniref:Uncharacterized protein n=1 Tax=Favolaschia claudopus TaxID=2862362 RepID=A0AAV9Z7H5_9AGAR